MHPRAFEHTIFIALLGTSACSAQPSLASGEAGGAAGVATSTAATTSSSGQGGHGQGGSSPAGGGLASKYPGDVGIENNPAVVWAENFEEGSVAAITARYDNFKDSGLALVTDVPPASSGQASLELTASGAGPTAVNLYKNLAPGYDELFVRYYANYEPNVDWHHTGVSIGGYNPPLNWPAPQPGYKPTGHDLFSVALEPQDNGATPRLEFYNYWMQMHSWKDALTGTNDYFGNSLIHNPSLEADGWMCIELHVKLNPDPASRAGAELGIWVDDVPVIAFTDSSPLGYWVKDKFCPENATGTECTNYPPPPNTPMIALDLQYRATTDLKLNAFWPQNYITSGGPGSVYYDDMVLATERIGCIQ